MNFSYLFSETSREVVQEICIFFSLLTAAAAVFLKDKLITFHSYLHFCL